MKRIISLYWLCLTCASPLLAQTAEEYLSSGNQKYDSGDFLASIRDYTKAIQLRPDFALAKSNLEKIKGQ